jgi:cytoskeletal protein CcmA (bactofilin family)
MAEPAKDVAGIGKDTAVIGEDASFSGRFVGKDLLLLGKLEGDIELRGRLHLGPKGHARANVRAATVEVEGELNGEIRADALSLLPTARVRGTILAKRLSVQEGAVVEGSINPGSARHAEPSASPFAPPPAPAAPPAQPWAARPSPPAAAPAPHGSPAPSAPATPGPAAPGSPPEKKPEGDPPR